MLADCHGEHHVAGLATVWRRVTLAAQANLLLVGHAGGDLRLDGSPVGSLQRDGLAMNRLKEVNVHARHEVFALRGLTPTEAARAAEATLLAATEHPRQNVFETSSLESTGATATESTESIVEPARRTARSEACA